MVIFELPFASVSKTSPEAQPYIHIEMSFICKPMSARASKTHFDLKGCAGLVLKQRQNPKGNSEMTYAHNKKDFHFRKLEIKTSTRFQIHQYN